ERLEKGDGLPRCRRDAQGFSAVARRPRGQSEHEALVEREEMPSQRQAKTMNQAPQADLGQGLHERVAGNGAGLLRLESDALGQLLSSLDPEPWLPILEG